MHWSRYIILATALSLALVSSPDRASGQFDVVAPYWIVYDATSDRVLASERADEAVPIASLTKMMTGLLAVEQLSPGARVTIVEGDQVGEASIWAEAGDVLTVRTLLYGLMMRSGNDAASALGRAVGGSPQEEDQAARDRFAVMMNVRAWQLGMTSTRFQNPHGLHEADHYSSARDLMVLTKEAMSHPLLVQAFGAEFYSGEGYHWEHTNRLPSQYTGVVGGKTGWTIEAGLCLIQVAERGGRTLIVVLLGSTAERWYPDAIDLLNYGWRLPGEPAANSDFGPIQW